MEPTRIVFIFILKVIYISCCLPGLRRRNTVTSSSNGTENNVRSKSWIDDVSEAIAMTVSDEHGDFSSSRSNSKLFRLPVLLSMLIISSGLCLQMYDSLQDVNGYGSAVSTDDYIVGFFSLFLCLLLNACENVWW